MWFNSGAAAMAGIGESSICHSAAQGAYQVALSAPLQRPVAADTVFAFMIGSEQNGWDGAGDWCSPLSKHAPQSNMLQWCGHKCLQVAYKA